jgi:hypothetical protein
MNRHPILVGLAVVLPFWLLVVLALIFWPG